MPTPRRPCKPRGCRTSSTQPSPTGLRPSPARVVVMPVVLMPVVVMAPVATGEVGSERREAVLVQLVSQDPACLRPAVDVVGGVGGDAPVVDEHADPMVSLGPPEQLVGEAPLVVVVPGGVLADHERKVAPVAIEVPERRPDPRRCELRVDVG